MTIRAWRRRLLFAASCLLLGAVTTVGVAWGSAAELIVEDDRADWLLHVTGRPGAYDVQVVRSASASFCFVMRCEGVPHRGTGVVPSWAHEAADPTHAEDEVMEFATSRFGVEFLRHYPWAKTPNSEWTMAYSWAHGWPWRSMSRSEYAQVKTAASKEEDGWEIGDDLDVSLPCRPIACGCLGGTLFYAVPWWALLVTPGGMRRWRRKRRGACLACGYDLRGLGDGAACPECGGTNGK